MDSGHVTPVLTSDWSSMEMPGLAVLTLSPEEKFEAQLISELGDLPPPFSRQWQHLTAEPGDGEL